MSNQIENIVLKLNKKLDFFTREISRLEMDLIFKEGPAARLRIEEHLEEAKQYKKAIELALEHINKGTVTEKDFPEEINSNDFKIESLNLESISSNKHNRNKSTNYHTSEKWYKKPIGIVGLTVFSGVIVVLAVYLIKKYLEIPL